MCGIDSFEARYKVLEKIGEGSFSEVLKVEHKATGKYFAAKRLKKHYKFESNLLTCAEVIAAKKVPYHINILNMLEYHYDSFSGRITFVFEVMDMSLYDYFKGRKRGMAENRVKGYLFQMLRGLEHLHNSGLFHRDVKPENILIKFPKYEDEEVYNNVQKYDLIKLADLGSVRGIYSTPPYTEYISTRWYRSPECLLTNGNYGPKMDIWATGCVFFEMLTSRPLFPGNNELDQLARIHAILSTPTIQFLSKLKSKSRNCIFFPKQRGCGVDCLLPNISRHGRSILQLMIEYDSDKRINVRRLLRNLYFDDVRDTFELTPDGVYNKKPITTQQTKIPRYIRRNAGDHFSNASSESTKLNRSSKDSSLDRGRRSNHSAPKKSAESGSKPISRVHTPSIEIPYYTNVGSKQKISMNLVDFKIKKSMDESRDGSKDKLESKSLRKNLEIILKSRGSEGGHKYQKEKASNPGNQLTSKSMVLPKKREYSKIDSIEKLSNQTRRLKISSLNNNKKYI